MLGLFRKKSFNEIDENQERLPIKSSSSEPRLPAKSPAVQEAVRYAKGTTIRYDEMLVDKLKGDHQELLSLFTEISDSAQKGDYRKCNDLLGRFKARLTDHLLNENVKLYVFLDCHMEADEMNATLVRSFRQEMDKIGKVVMDFLRRYQKLEVSENNVTEFSNELAGIGNVLVDRINREESTLYSMYEMV